MNPTDPPEEVRRALELRLLSYTRGIDRLDTDLIASAFHPGALMEGYGRPEPVSIEAFLERTVPRLRNHYRSTQHRVSNLTFTMLDAAVELKSSAKLGDFNRASTATNLIGQSCADCHADWR